MRIIAAQSMDLFVGSEEAPHQVVRMSVAAENAATAAGYASVTGEGIRTPAPAALPALRPGERATAEVSVQTGDGAAPGAALPATAVVQAGPDAAAHEFELIVAEPGWRMFMVSHFHYDPVWWNTQSAYTEDWFELPAALERRLDFQATGMDLVSAHLDMARRDPDYRFVLAELDYLKPYWDVHPERRDEIRALLRAGRLELIGGTYNEANTNLVSAENTARNAIYGIAYQRDVLGGSPATAWQLDVFGHDPQFPGLMAAAGLGSASFARGPFHEWGPNWSHGMKPELREEHSVGGAPQMQFATEFEWVSPSGRGLLTSYMANHYSAGWWMDAAASLAEAEAEAWRLFGELKEVAATRNVLLPVGTDYSPPNRWVTQIQRDWSSRYTWPKFVCATAADFFDAVRGELAEQSRSPVPQTRDMNPIYTGKDVSFIDTKQMHRAAENTLQTAEKFATLACMLGARYPSEAIDKAWRQLIYNAHHDGITGSESDQVYLDLLAGWREAHDLAVEVRDRSLAHLGTHIDTSGEGLAVTVFNPMSWPRDDLARVRLRLDDWGAAGAEIIDEAGRPAGFLVESERHRDDGALAAATLVFLARDVPGIGYRTYRVRPSAASAADGGWRPADGLQISSERWIVEVDPARGGAMSRLLDRQAERELLAPGGVANEVLAYDEYPDHPHFAEGPWHLTPTGVVATSTEASAQVRAERCAIGQRLIVTSRFHDCDWTHEITLWEGSDRVEVRIRMDGWSGQDTLFRVRAAADVEGGMPLSEVANAVVGRGFAFPGADVANAKFTLDNPCGGWFGIGSTAVVRLADRAARAISVAEIVAPEDQVADPAVRDLVVALVRQGVTSTTSADAGPRYGRIDLDSNLPDVRIALGGPERNAFTAAVLDAADPAYAVQLRHQLEGGRARLWVPAERPLAEVWKPGANLCGVRDLPVLILAGDADDRAIADAVADLADAVIEVEQPAQLDGTTGQVDDRTIAVLNRGTPGFAVDTDGGLHLSLLRACSGWPSGVWIDPPRRTAPDGSNFQFQHWSHTFEYAITAAAGDWRAGDLVRRGHDYDNPLLALALPSRPGSLPSAAALLAADPPQLVISALKPAGNPLARMAAAAADPGQGIAIRAWHAGGQPVAAAVRAHWPLRDGARADLLEERREPLGGDGRALRVDVHACDIVTLVATPDLPAGAPDGQRPALGRRAEAAQPVFSDYWLHNRGVAPLGYQPVTVQIAPSAVAADGPFTLPVTVASERTDEPAAGRVTLVAPAGWRRDPPGRIYRLAPGAHLEFDAVIAPPADTPPGRYFVAARISDDLGQVHEDVVTVDITGPVAADRAPAAAPSAAEARRPPPLEVVDGAAAFGIRGELDVRVPARLTVAAGDRAQLAVVLRNASASQIRGEAQLLTPFETWPAIPTWNEGFAVPAGGSQVVAFPIDIPPEHLEGTFWALVKVMYFGRRLYSPALPLVIRQPVGAVAARMP